MNPEAAAKQRTAAARRNLSALCAAALCVLWFFGVFGLPLPSGVCPRVNPSGYCMAQILLFLPILSAALPILKSGVRAMRAVRPDAAALLLLATAAALADAALLAVRVALAADDGALLTASRLAAESPLPMPGTALAAAAFAARRKDWQASRTVMHTCRILLPCLGALSFGICGMELLRGAGFAAAMHTALLVLSLGAPPSLLLAAPLLAFAAGKRTARPLSCRDREELGAATAICFDDAAMREAAPSLDDLYVTAGSKTALLAAAAALADGAENPYAAALQDAAAYLGLRLPHAAHGPAPTEGFGGTVHRRAWRFVSDGADAPELIRRTDFGGRQALYAFADGAFCGVLLFANAPLPDAAAAQACLRAEGLAVTVGDRQTNPHVRREKVLHVTRDGATIRLTNADGTFSMHVPTPAVLAETVLLARRMTAALRTAVGVSAAALLLCVLLAADVGSLGAAALTAAAAIRLAATVTVLLLSCFVRRMPPPEIHVEEERPAMFGKVNYTIHVEGMSCSHCAAHVKTALESIRGVSADVVLDEKVAHVKCPAALDEKQLAAAVTEAGFTVASVERV